MARTANIRIAVALNKKANSALFYLASMSSGDATAHKIKFNGNQGTCSVSAPGKFMLTWYFSGAAGGAMQADIFDGKRKIDVLTKEETEIPDGLDENYGLLEFELE